MSNNDKEELRHIILEGLANRHPVALPPRAIARIAAREVFFKFELEDVEGALEMLRDLGHAKFDLDPVGSTKYWQATSQGVLSVERALNLSKK